MRHIWWTFVAIVVVFLAALYIDYPNTSNVFGQPARIVKGIDLAGGVRLLECAKHPVSAADLSTARDVINSRASQGLGVTEPQVTTVGNRCISVELPGVKNQQSAINTVGKTGFLALTDSGTTNLAPQTKVKLVCQTAGCAPGLKTGVTNTGVSPPVLAVVVPGKYVTQGSAQVGFGTNGNSGPEVDYALHGAGSDAWCTYTTNHVKNFSAIVLDGKVVSDPTIQGAICGGQTAITGLTSTAEAKQIATFLNYGALPVALHVDSSSQVAASLGPQYVNDAFLAGIVGLVIVAIFMLAYYRLPGLLADVALIMYAAVVFAEFKLLGVTMTLAGIAGFILSIGMAVDANVLIFERMREELRAGKTLGAAVEAGFSRAWPSIRDSNASTIITTIILFVFGHNFAATVITGFATTLFLGVVTSFITAYFVSKTFLRLLVLSGALRDPRLFGAESVPAVPGGQVA